MSLLCCLLRHTGTAAKIAATADNSVCAVLCLPNCYNYKALLSILDIPYSASSLDEIVCN